MTTYTTIADASIDQDSPVTEALMEALGDNPIALAEGASGAPRIAIKTGYVSVAAGLPGTLTGVDAFSGLTLSASFINSGVNTRVISISFSDDTVTFYGTTTIATVSNSGHGSLHLAIDFATGQIRGHFNAISTIGGYDATISGTSTSIRSVRITCETDLTVHCLFQLNGGESAT